MSEMKRPIPSFRRMVRASRLLSEGKCPGCEMDYKPQIAALERRARIAERALTKTCDEDCECWTICVEDATREIDAELAKEQAK